MRALTPVLVVLTDETSDLDARDWAVLSLCAVLAVRFGLMGITLKGEHVIVRGVFRTWRVPTQAIASVGMEPRWWYLKGGTEATVLRLLSGRRIASLGLSGLGRKTNQKADALADALHVPRRDDW